MDSSLLAALSSLLLLGLALYLARLALLGKRRRSYPPVAGVMLQQLLNWGRLPEYMTELSRRYGTFRMLTPTCNHVYTVDPANVEYILRTNFANYGKGAMTHDALEDLLGDGIFNVDGAKWRHQRKVASFEFTTRALRDYSSGVFRDMADELAGRRRCCGRGEGGHGEPVHAVDAGLDFHGWVRGQPGLAVRIQPRGRGVRQGVRRRQRAVAVPVLGPALEGQEAPQRLVGGGHEAAKKGDILSRFLVEREKDPGCFDNKYLRDIILNFVIAGRDTTAGGPSWVPSVLCREPTRQGKIAREVREATIGDHQDAGCVQEFTACLTEDAIGSMHSLHAALTETLRLYPAVPTDVKCCFSDDTLPDGHAVRRGDMVNYQPYAMGRMKFLWGDDAEEFRPERWLDDDGVFVPESPYKFTAFQAGPRICLGKEFAYRQMKIFAAVLLYLFRFEMWEHDSRVGHRPMLTLKMDGPLYVRASPRRSTGN
uniref:Cytochrome P450 704C1 n=1 Tax=Aegilops tauschii TaxID=37682 RepID=M8CUK2_AEGTA